MSNRAVGFFRFASNVLLGTPTNNATGSGNGKALALMAAVNAFVKSSIPALYITLVDLLGLMRAVFTRPKARRSFPAGED